ncbi:ATP-binding cassette domain-containing protein, partial [Mesorhizobium sp. M4A.F.Ca.ET.020.02.1.1]
MSLLALSDVSVSYGPLTAVRNVTLEVGQGEIVFLAGPNGAGKSTLLRAVAGVLAPSQGKITLAGTPTAGLRSEALVRLGFTLVPEGREIFGSLSVAENLAIGAYLRRDRDGIDEDMDFVLTELPALKPRLRDPAGLLSGGQQQMLAIGRALMTRASLIAIDEPSLGLA